jgi:ABC-type antimicrobial peptide transport system permease subunit
MRSLPLFKFGPRARSTSWGIALCTMFIVASFSVAGGLKTSMDKLSGNFAADKFLITKPGPSGPEYFLSADLDSILTKFAVGTFVETFATPFNESVTVFSVQDVSRVIGETYYVSGSYLLAGSDIGINGPVTFLGPQNVSGTIVGKYVSSVFPNDWVMGSEEFIHDLTGEASMMYNFAIAKGLNATSIAGLQELGFEVEPLMGIVDFLKTSVNEIQADATWVLLPSAFVIAVLAYSFLGSETADRRHDIGIIKTLGAGRGRVLSYLLINALLISAYGGLLGVALGIVLSYALSTAASAMFTSVFIIKSSEVLLVSAFGVTLLSGVLGALIPAVRMTFTSPVQDLKEVAPFS